MKIEVHYTASLSPADFHRLVAMGKELGYTNPSPATDPQDFAIARRVLTEHGKAAIHRDAHDGGGEATTTGPPIQ